MSEAPIVPKTVDDCLSLVSDKQQVIAVGNQTKSPLSNCPQATPVSLRKLSGITQYEPSEFTFTARAGTTLKEITKKLRAKKQYLPFDPLLISAGATIGGTVAAGISGPGRFRYGGIRDFLLGVNFISGDAKLIRAGGKVVKNAAGFDIPKFMIGSLGRFGVITELTFKVFPNPIATQTMRIQCESHAQAVERMAVAAKSTWELDAIDYRAEDKMIYLRIGGPQSSVESIAAEISQQWSEAASSVKHSGGLWKNAQELNWSSQHQIIVKVPVTPTAVQELTRQLPGQLWFSAAANVLWLGLKDDAQVCGASDALTAMSLKGLVFRGDSQHCHIGKWGSYEIESRLKQAFDPTNKFPAVVRCEENINR